MRAQLKHLGVPFQISDAVDGRELGREEVLRAAPYFGTDYGGMLTNEEIGCALSHLAVLRQFTAGRSNYLAVLEDDVCLLPEFREVVDEGYLRSLPEFDVLQLDGAHPYKPRLTLQLGRVGRHDLCAVPKCHHSMYALIYTRHAARAITACISDVTAPIDNMIFKDGRVTGLRIVALRPSVVTHSSLPSVIGRRPALHGLPRKLERETRRLISWSRRWRSFVQAWGMLSIPGLRLQNPNPVPGRLALQNLAGSASRSVPAVV
jgi:GR25 family glycosyltransferase involved in LPS biosynthesis